MYEIVSGNIVAGVIYQIYGDLTIEYNSIQYSEGDYFIGISGITTYTTSGGTGTEINWIIANTSDSKNAYPSGFSDVGQTWVNILNTETDTYAYELYYFNVFIHSQGTGGVTLLCEVFDGIGYSGTKLGETTAYFADGNGTNKTFNFISTTPSILLSPDQTLTMKITKVGGGTFGIGETATTYTYNVIKNGSVSSQYWDFIISGFGFDAPPVSDGIVTEASIYLGQSTEIEDDFYVGNFPDASSYLGQSAEIADPLLFEIVSGNIVAGVIYFVDGGTSIVYNGITVNTNEFFIGVDGITEYTKTSGDELVTETSSLLGISTEIENDFYLDHFTDDSKYLGQSTGIGDPWLFEIVSGNIAPGITYFVDGGTSIVYNSVIDYFTPIMTSNTTPEGICSGSSVFNATYDYWKAFNRTAIDKYDCWITVTGASLPQWVSYEATTAKVINKLEYVNRNNSSGTALGRSPKNFLIQGSNNGINWIDIAAFVNIIWTSHNESKIFNFLNNIAYLHHRIYVTETQNTTFEYLEASKIIFYYDGTFNSTEFFIGVDGITDYTKTDNTELVTEATKFLGQSFAFENDYYLGLFNDDSTFKGLSFTIADNPGRVITTIGNKGTFPKTEIIGEWLLNGTATDTSKNSRNGTDLGVTYVNDRHAALTSAIDTASADILIQDWDLLPETNWTISFWQNSQSTNSNSSSFTIGDRDSTNKIINHRKFTTQYVSFIDSVSGFIQYDTGVILDDDTWNHIIIMQTGSTFKYYVNAELKYSNTLNGVNLVSSNDISLGSFTDSDKRYWGGYLDDLRIYDRGLTTNEMWLLYNE